MALACFAGCSGSGSGTGGSGDAVAPVIATAGDGSSAPAATVETAGPAATAAEVAAESGSTAPVAAVDGAALLRQALEAIAGGYHFTTTVTVDGVTALVADGDHVAGSTRLTITGDAGTIAYVVTPDGAWVLPDEEGEWEAVEAPAAAVDPIAALWSPTSVDVQGTDGAQTVLGASVPSPALGIASEAPAALQLVLHGTELRDVTYLSSLDGLPASVQATITPLVDTSPVIAPV